MSEPPANPTGTRTVPIPPPDAPSDVPASTVPHPHAAPGSHLNELPHFEPPTHAGDLGRFGRYRVLQRIGAGGMGAVYLAHDDTLDRQLALKVMLPRHAANPQAKVRFLREARTAATVRSEHVVAILDVDEIRGVPFILMEYLQGVPLNRYLATHSNLSVSQVIRLGLEVTQGLAAAHAHGLIHRDIKPANLFLEAPHGRVKILDFGLAKEAEPVTDESGVTHTGQVVGTPAYMSPEQARGEAVDARTDLFSLGVVLYKLCTGRQPFRGATPMAMLMSLGMDEPTPVRELNSAVPVPLADLIRRLLAKKASDRPQTAVEVHAALVAIEDGLAVTSTTTTQPDYVPIAVDTHSGEVWGWVDEEADSPAVSEPRSQPEKRPFPWLVSAGVLAALVSVGLLVVVLQYTLPKPPPEGLVEEKPQPPVRQPKPPPKPHPDRAAAEALHPYAELTLMCRGEQLQILPGNPLPTEPFVLIGIRTGKPAPNGRELLATLLELRSLQEFHDHVNLFGFTDADVTALANTGFVTEVRKLSLNDLELSPAVIKGLKRFPQLSSLGIRFGTADDAVLKQFAREMIALPNISPIGFGASGALTKEGVEAFASMPLGYLMFTNCHNLKPEWCRIIAKLPKLTELGFQQSNFDDAMLEELVGGSFQHLYLYQTDVTDAGLKTVAKMKQLKSVGMQAPITDAGLEHLHSATHLSNITMQRSEVTADGVRKLQQALPKCTVLIEVKTKE